MRFSVQTPLLVSGYRHAETNQRAENIEKVYPVF